MRIPDREFVPYAPDSPGVVRINHNTSTCSGTSNSLKITRSEDGTVYAKCFRCGGIGRFSDSVSKYAKVKRKALGVSGKVNQVYMPSDLKVKIGEMPVVVRTKLSQYSLTQKDIDTFGLGWSQRYNRFIIPVYRSGELVGWQGRCYDDHSKEPKYITKYKDSGDLYAYILCTGSIVGDGVCVVVEDMLSGIRVARHANALVCFGSNISDSGILRSYPDNSKYLIFLDDDNRTVKLNQLDIKNRLTALGKDATIIAGVGKDPKELPDSELRTIILSNT